MRRGSAGIARTMWRRRLSRSITLIIYAAGAEPLAGVVRHNQMDLRGLAALFCKVTNFFLRRQMP